MGPSYPLPALLAFALGAAGCVGPGTLDGPAPIDDPDAHAEPVFELVGRDCIEGGGQSVAPRSIVGTTPFAIPPDPWERADVLEDTGPQLVYTQVTDPANPIPREGHTWGHIHATLHCTSWTFNGVEKPGFVFGYVGAKVEEPEFGTTEVSRSYLVTVLAVSDAEVREALHAAGIHATDASAIMEFDEKLLHTVLDTEHNGKYETIFVPKRLGEMPKEPFRLWWQSETTDGYRPVALDMAHPGGGAHHGAEVQAYFSHTGTHMHGPQGGAAAPTAAVLWSGHDRVITLGPRADLILEQAYEH